MHHEHNETGSATIFALAMGVVIVGAGIILLAVVQLAVMRSELGSYADLSALAASSEAANSCRAAQQVAQMNNVDLVACTIDSGSVQVTVRAREVPNGLLGWVSRELQVSARASYSFFP